jgi:hypothetical protein
MNFNCVFTICAKNYIGLAQILGMTVNKYNNDTDFYIVVADEFEACDKVEIAENILVAKNILNVSQSDWTNMSFKYNLTEFCTSIKPFSFEYFFNKKNYSKVIYLDPDTFLFESLNYVYTKLDTHLFVTAPHITIPHVPYTGDLSDTSFLFNGISNLGFLGVRKSDKSLEIITWWEDRLKQLCFGEMLWAVCTDQKWMDYLPAFLDYNEIYFSNNLGLNIAPWNYFERKVIIENGEYFIISRSGIRENKDKLIFAHFAGYNYKEFASNKVKNNKSRMRISNLKEYDDINAPLQNYIDCIWKNRTEFLKYLSLSYTYSTFDNGIRIDKLHRRLYNGMNTNFGYSKNPFSTDKDSFYCLLKSKKLFAKEQIGFNVDSLSPNNLDGFSRKLSLLYSILRIFYWIIGYKNYILFLQFIRRISLYDINTYLLGKKFENKTLR